MNNNVNNEERKNNGQGIFYAVIGVATLVVTIIGATFAFFSASAGSNVNAVAAGAAVVSLELTEDTTGIKRNLIPMDETNSKFAGVISSNGDSTKRCLDDNGNEICSVYQFTLRNPSSNTAALTVYPTLTSNVNEFENLHYIVFKGDVSNVPTNANIGSGTAAPVSSKPLAPDGVVVNDGTIVVANGTVPAASTSHIATGTASATSILKLQNMIQTLNPGASITYTIVMWIHETGEDQTNTDSVIRQGSTSRARVFEADLSFNTSGGSGGVTGKLSTTG